MSGAEATDLPVYAPDAIAPSIPSGSRLTVRKNVGADLDRVVQLVPPGAAREFVRGLPRRVDREELLACLEALVRLMQVEQSRR
jgi:hypothetical protein